MSSDVAERIIELRKKDPVSVSTEVRAQLHLGAVHAIVVDMLEGRMFVERSASAQKEIDLRADQAEAMASVVDPVEVVLGGELQELRVTGMSLKEALFTAMHVVEDRGAHVAYWACGNLEYLAKLGDFKLPMMKSDPLKILGVPTVESPEVAWNQVIACVASVRDALPVEVEKGLVISLEDLSDAKPAVRSAPVLGPGPEGGHRTPPPRREADQGGSPPPWFGGS